MNELSYRIPHQVNFILSSIFLNFFFSWNEFPFFIPCSFDIVVFENAHNLHAFDFMIKMHVGLVGAFVYSYWWSILKLSLALDAWIAWLYM
jgi:hypothetical protein